MLRDYWRRHKGKILALAAASATGVAAYCIYRRWRPDGGEGQEGETLVDPRGSRAMAARDAEAHLQHHFESIQDIADNTTIPSLLPALEAALNRAADVDSLLEKLRQSKEAGGSGSGGPQPLSGTSKVALWEELKLTSFTRAVGALWLLPLLDLFVRVQLNILGRHLYLESAVDSRRFSPVTGGPPLPLPRLSASSQEQFLSYAEHLSREGAGALLALVRGAVERALRDVALQAPLTSEGLGKLLSQILADFTEVAHAAGWDSFLLPPPSAAELSEAAAQPDGRAALSPQQLAEEADAEAVGGMLSEARQVLTSPRFHDTLVASVRELSRDAVGRLCERLAAGPLPLAKLVPAVAAVGADYLDPGTHSVAQLAQLKQVYALCAMVYSSPAVC